MLFQLIDLGLIVFIFGGERVIDKYNFFVGGGIKIVVYVIYKIEVIGVIDNVVINFIFIDSNIFNFCFWFIFNSFIFCFYQGRFGKK